MPRHLFSPLIAILLLLGNTVQTYADGIPISTPAGLWEFNNSSNIGLATLGSNLTVVGANPTFTANMADDGGTSLGGVISTVGGTANRLRATYSLPANGGGSYLNEYTLLYDIFSPSGSRSSYRSLFQTSGDANNNDGDYFIRNSDDKMGTAALGYTGTALTDSRWKRVVIVADLGSFFRVYVDGALVHSHTSQAVDGRYALFTSGPLLLFADDSNENATLNVGAVAMWGKSLSAAEITALGVAGAPIQGATIPNQSPVITQGTSFNMPGAALNGPAVTATLNATDAESDAVTWSVSTAAAHGTAAITTSSSTQAGISYIPTPGFTGVDTFQIRAADTGGADTIAVTVVVMDPNVLLWPEPAGLWEYDFSVAPTLATTGADLEVQGNSFTSVNGAFTDDGAQQVEVASRYRVTNPVGANGGGSYSNRYTLLWDVFIPSATFGGWKTLLQTSSSNNNDGDLFINTSGQIGTAAGFNGYTTNALKPGTWHRVVLKVVNGTSNGTTLWVDGQKWLTTTTTGGVDGRYGLEDQFLILADDDGEDGQIQISNFAMWNDALGDTEITALSGVTRRVTNKARPEVNFPPVITEGTSTTLAAQMNTATPVVLNVTDADSTDTITWTVSGAAAHGSAVVSASSNTQATITYTPTASYNGPDSFTIQASDGTASDSIEVNVTVQNSAPVISEGGGYNLAATTNGGARTVTFHAADPNGNPLTWSVSSAATHGTASIISNDNTEGIVSYTPEAGYSGPDGFTVSVTDGALSDSIVVNVTVSDPAAQPKLTIVAPHGTGTPAAGVYSHPRGTALTNSIADESGATTRHLCTGWTMTGDGPSSGTGNTMNMTLTRDSVLTWNFRTEHRVETAINGGGTVSATSGWYEAGRALQITATPDAGQYFVGWSGDTAGCQTGGKNIVVPMDRPRATITATFAVNEDFVFVALPDTQNYTSISSPTDLYTRQTQWIVDNKETMNIRFVTHLGDLVNSPSSQSQWQRCTDAMNLMNNRMPYGTCPGNHDLATGDTNYVNRFGPNPTHSSSIGRWIDPDNSQTYDWYRGASPRGYSSYQIVTVNGRDYMFMHLDMDTPDQDLAWAAGVLAAHPKTLTMVTTHNYLAESGGSGIYGSGTGQRGRTAQANISIGPDRNRPLDVFNAVVKPFNQVYMVICGHNFATYNIQATNDAGKQVHEVLVDWQSLPNGGNGFLRIMEFRPQQNQIVNTSYSPYLGRYVDPNNNADHQGMLDLHDRNGSEFILPTDFDTRFNTDLTIVSAHGGVTPAAGTYSIETGTPVAISAVDQVVGQTRYRPTGWALSGGQTGSGSGSSAVITQGAASTLTWNYATEHYLTISTVGSGIASTGSGWQAAGATVNIQAQPDAGATFLQWSGDISGCTIAGTGISVPMDRPRGPITAQFSSALPSHSVQVVSVYPGVAPGAATYTYEQGQSVTFSAADIAGADTRRICTGYSVTGAVTQSGTEKSFSLAITGDMTVTWNWTTQYLLATAANGPGTVSTGSGIWVNENAAASVTATANAGAGFVSWSGDTALGSATGGQFSIAAMTRPVGTLTANFTAAMHTLTVVSSQAGTTPAPGVHPYAFGATVEFSALTAESNGSRQRPAGWALGGATSGSGSSTRGSFVVQGDTTLTWTHEPEVLLSITGGAEGVVLPMNAAGWHALGSTVALQAAPASAWFSFKQWTGDVPAGSTNPELSLTMNQPRSITADFTTTTTADGTPNWWLNTFAKVIGGNYEAARMGDNDGDGLSAWEEFVAGTSDLDANEHFHVSAIAPSPDRSTLSFRLPMSDGRLYQLMESSTLGAPFTPVGAPVAPEPPEGIVSIPFPAAVASRFYSIQVVLGGTSTRDADRAAASSAPLPEAVVRAMAKIPAGAFIQGEDSGPVTTRPEHVTHVSAVFMDKFEVTRADWEAVATWALAHGYDIPVTLRFNQAPYNVPPDHPAVAVSWYDAVKWCNARSEMEGRRPVYFADTSATTVYRSGQVDLTAAHVNWAGDGYRLPTEAEWERASRGGLEQKPYAWGDAASDLRANHWDYQVIQGRAPNGPYPYTERVGFFDGTQPGGAPDMANAYGLYDMAGNAWEWTWDRMGDYSADKQYDPRGAATGTQRVQRGGSWWNYIDQATNHQRLPFPPDGSDDYGMIGFRCVRATHPNE